MPGNRLSRLEAVELPAEELDKVRLSGAGLFSRLEAADEAPESALESTSTPGAAVGAALPLRI